VIEEGTPAPDFDFVSNSGDAERSFRTAPDTNGLQGAVGDPLPHRALALAQRARGFLDGQ
jgi:hypothetical protein